MMRLNMSSLRASMISKGSKCSITDSSSNSCAARCGCAGQMEVGYCVNAQPTLQFMIGFAQLMHAVHQRLDVLWIHVLMDAVAEIEHMTWACAVGLQYRRGLGAEAFRGCVQHARAHIALSRDAVADTQPRRADVGGPIHAP